MRRLLFSAFLSVQQCTYKHTLKFSCAAQGWHQHPLLSHTAKSQPQGIPETASYILHYRFWTTKPHCDILQRALHLQQSCNTAYFQRQWPCLEKITQNELIISVIFTHWTPKNYTMTRNQKHVNRVTNFCKCNNKSLIFQYLSYNSIF